MVVEPKIRGFICTTAHPVGCAQHVKSQIEYIRSQSPILGGPKNVLIIGASTGYGLAARIAATYGANAKTIGVFFEKPASDKRTASAGWYNTAAFEKFAHIDGHYAKSINGDAFSHEIKQTTIDLIKQDLGKIDCVIYSLASPRRKDPDSDVVYNSTLKPVGKTYTNKTVDPLTGTVSEISLPSAEGDDISNTIAVMGGDDWRLWINALQKANVLTDDATTCAFSYVGPELTHPIYKNGTIGKAKDHLLETAHILQDRLSKTGGRAFISVNKALVTQASSAIPVVPLYMSILFKIMKAKRTHEGCIEQLYRLFKDFMYGNHLLLDEEGRVRIDDYEMDPEVQAQVAALWKIVSTDNINELTDIVGYRRDFYRLFGFEWSDVDYRKDVEIDVAIPSLKNLKIIEP